MTDNRKYSSEKAWQQFGSRTKRKSFQLLRHCQSLSASIENATAKCEKNYRQGIVAEVRNNAYSLVHETRRANYSRLGTKDRLDAQKNGQELLNRIYDLIPVLRMCRLITPTQEGLIEKELCFIKSGYEKWLQSDLQRLFGDINKQAEKVLENTRLASIYYSDKKIDLKYELSLLEKVCNPTGLNEDVMTLATIFHQIEEEHINLSDFFLMNKSENKRFVFCNKLWTKFFALQAVSELQIQIQYRDERGFFYETDSIENAIKLYKIKKISS